MNVNKADYEIGRGPRQQKSPNEQAAPGVAVPGLAGQPEDETGSGSGDAGDHAGIDGVRPAVLRQMEQRIAADQRHIAPAGTVNVPRLSHSIARVVALSNRRASAPVAAVVSIVLCP